MSEESNTINVSSADLNVINQFGNNEIIQNTFATGITNALFIQNKKSLENMKMEDFELSMMTEFPCIIIASDVEKKQAKYDIVYDLLNYLPYDELYVYSSRHNDFSNNFLIMYVLDQKLYLKL